MLLIPSKTYRMSLSTFGWELMRFIYEYCGFRAWFFTEWESGCYIIIIQLPHLRTYIH